MPNVLATVSPDRTAVAVRGRSPGGFGRERCDMCQWNRFTVLSIMKAGRVIDLEAGHDLSKPARLKMSSYVNLRPCVPARMALTAPHKSPFPQVVSVAQCHNPVRHQLIRSFSRR